MSRYVVVRDHRAGVYAGILMKSKRSGIVVLKNARHLWSWQGALSTAEIAASGISGGKLSNLVPRVELRDVVSIIDCTATAQQSIHAVKSWAR